MKTKANQTLTPLANSKINTNTNLIEVNSISLRFLLDIPPNDFGQLVKLKFITKIWRSYKGENRAGIPSSSKGNPQSFRVKSPKRAPIFPQSYT